MTQEKVIYLDFDGVINDEETPLITIKTIYGNENHHVGICPRLVEKINQIYEATGAVVWIHSSWRDSYSSEQLRDLLANTGLRAEVIGNVPSCHERKMGSLYSQRGPDIRLHVKVNNIEKYVILDDMNPSFFEFEDRDFHVQTDSMIGIQDQDVQRAIEILNS